MKTVNIKLYSFKELPAKIQDQVISNYSDINVNYDWWDFTHDDARNNAGLEITSFDLDRRKIEGEFVSDAETAAKYIVENFGPCYVKAGAENFLSALESLRSNEANSEDFREEETENLSNDFLQLVLKDYLKDLKNEYEYRLSKEQIIETIEANEYLFFADGKLIPVDMYPKAKPSLIDRARKLLSVIRQRMTWIDLVLFAPSVIAIIRTLTV
jgi:hypothetical protein